MAVDESRHQDAPREIDLPRGRSHPGAESGIAPDIHDAAAAHRECLLHAVVRVYRVDDAVAIDRIGPRGAGLRSLGSEDLRSCERRERGDAAALKSHSGPKRGPR